MKPQPITHHISVECSARWTETVDLDLAEVWQVFCRATGHAVDDVPRTSMDLLWKWTYRLLTDGASRSAPKDVHALVDDLLDALPEYAEVEDVNPGTFFETQWHALVRRFDAERARLLPGPGQLSLLGAA